MPSPVHKGKNALITGGASGIGKSLAAHLVSHGARVVCCDMNTAVGQRVVEAINAERPNSPPVAFFVKMNVTSWEEVVDGFKKAEELLQSKIDFVFANAGIISGKQQCFPDEGGKPSTRLLDVNTTGVLYTMQAAINHFRAHKSRGSIIVTASIAGIYPLRPDPLYSASKHAVVGLVRSAAMRTEKEGIYINAIAPAATESGMTSQSKVKEMSALGLATSMATILQAFEVFLVPECRLFGQLAEPIGQEVNLIGYPLPVTRRPKETSPRL
ncbi:NAD(P)-binding protein [Cristinia sonorae]|uniref:NAD(P)-binding protein n=1 Tax=Cristinia sonorae TaxID=1940300 RepID=A0A8K0XTD7_9AGAR|nr:NAD(P)-binding protein [Cristinia sonorae]